MGGVEVDTQGDAFFLAFPTAPGASDAVSEFTVATIGSPCLPQGINPRWRIP